MNKEITLKSKLGALSDINQIIEPGSFVAIGGGWSCNKPMAIIREIIRQEIGCWAPAWLTTWCSVF
jgi:hypothetical protein